MAGTSIEYHANSIFFIENRDILMDLFKHLWEWK